MHRLLRSRSSIFTLRACSGYQQIGFEETDKAKTGFTTQNGLNRFKRTSLGLKTHLPNYSVSWKSCGPQ